MKTYTKEQIIEFYKKKAKFNKTINDNLPLLLSVLDDLEKPQFEPWRWYVNAHGSYMLYNPHGYRNQIGFTNDGKFINGFGTYGDWQPATKEQIEPFIRAEAEKRGFVEGAKFDSVPEFEGCIKYSRKNQSSIRYIHYNFKIDVLYSIYGVIYEKGRWATLVEEKSLEDRITELEKKVERLNEKLCQD